jgi:hypothetical protein
VADPPPTLEIIPARAEVVKPAPRARVIVGDGFIELAAPQPDVAELAVDAVFDRIIIVVRRQIISETIIRIPIERRARIITQRQQAATFIIVEITLVPISSTDRARNQCKNNRRNNNAHLFSIIILPP